jgi:hypothetical protein
MLKMTNSSAKESIFCDRNAMRKSTEWLLGQDTLEEEDSSKPRRTGGHSSQGHDESKAWRRNVHREYGKDSHPNLLGTGPSIEVEWPGKSKNLGAGNTVQSACS